jgi:NADPH:quinone reductase-like Zn-dependent oxidoreductase
MLTIESSSIKDLVPCSDMAGEIVFVGKDATGGWKVGDRVCANFCADHIDGDVTQEIQQTVHGGSIHGVLTEYKAFRPHVSFGKF